MTDGIGGLTSKLDLVFPVEFFPNRPIRMNCFFHVLQAVKRWLVRNGGPKRLKRLMQFKVLRELNAARSKEEFLYLWEMVLKKFLLREFGDPRSGFSKIGAFLDYVQREYIFCPEKQNWYSAAHLRLCHEDGFMIGRTNNVAEITWQWMKDKIDVSFLKSSKSFLVWAAAEFVPLIHDHVDRSMKDKAGPSDDEWAFAAMERSRMHKFLTLCGGKVQDFRAVDAKAVLICRQTSGFMLLTQNELDDITPGTTSFSSEKFVMRKTNFYLVTYSENCSLAQRQGYQMAICDCHMYGTRCRCPHTLALYMTFCYDDQIIPDQTQLDSLIHRVSVRKSEGRKASVEELELKCCKIAFKRNSIDWEVDDDVLMSAELKKRSKLKKYAEGTSKKSVQQLTRNGPRKLGRPRSKADLMKAMQQNQDRGLAEIMHDLVSEGTAYYSAPVVAESDVVTFFESSAALGLAKSYLSLINGLSNFVIDSKPVEFVRNVTQADQLPVDCALKYFNKLRITIMEDDESADSRNSEDPVQDPVERRAEISAAAANRRSGRKHSRSGMYGGGEARELRREQDRKRPAKLRDDSSDVE